jgi:serine/threonine protein kinase
VKAESKRVCEVCGTVLSNNSESCPVCALQAALQPEAGESSIEETRSESELRFEHYRVLQNPDGTPVELGHGAMGVTYKAFDVHLQCPVALKLINARFFGDASARHRFVREARAAASVRHPNVASVFHLGESGGNYYYAMEFVDGETLARLIQESGRIETEMALEVVAHVAAGLIAIQKQHLVHRDIKPSNIMVGLEEGRLETVKIIDLGLAKVVAEEDSISTAGSFTGTPGYASPEQFSGLGTDIRSDLYSLGITLWEMLVGKLPFQGSAAELMYQHQHAALPTDKLRSVSTPIVTLIQILLDKDPGKRLQSPARLLAVLPKVREAAASRSRFTVEELRSASDRGQSRRVNLRNHPVRWQIAAGLGLAGLLVGSLLLSVYRSAFFERGAEKVTATFSQGGEENIEAKPTDNLEAYDLYLQATQLIKAIGAIPTRTLETDLGVAISLLDKAVRLDPKFTRAYCAAAKAQDLLYSSYDAKPWRRMRADAAIESAMRLQPKLPEVHLAYAYHLEVAYRDHERARVQLAIARRDLPNNPAAIVLEAEIDRRQGNFEKAIRQLNAAITLDPRNPDCFLELAYTLAMTRQYVAAEQAWNRAIELAPNDHAILEVEKAAVVNLQGTGDDSPLRTAIAVLPTSMADNPEILCFRLNIAVTDRDWQQASELIEKIGGKSFASFAYSYPGVPADCYLILIARLQGGEFSTNSRFAAAREVINESEYSEGDLRALLLSQLAVVDALLGKKVDAIAEAKRAVEIRPISSDAIDGPGLLLNLVVVYAWSNELDKAFETLAPLTRTQNGISYGDLKLSFWWDPLRKDPRLDKLLSELAQKG